MTYEIRYRAGGREKLICFTEREETPELLCDATAEGGVHRLVLSPKEPVTLLGVKAVTDFDFKPSDVVMLNGYQSWTDSHEHTIREREGNLDQRMPKFVQKAFAMRAYGDYDFAEYSSSLGEFHGWTYGYVRRGERFTLFASLNERPGFTEVRIFPPKRYVQLRRDCEGLVIREPYEALHFVILKGSEQEIFDKWFDLMGIAGPKTPPITGYTSWYNFYQDISEEPEKYKGKTIQVGGRVMVRDRLPAGSFFFGRQLMTCCVEDISFAGLLATGYDVSQLHDNQWIELTAKVAVKHSKVYNKKGPVLTVQSVASGTPPEQEVATFY